MIPIKPATGLILWFLKLQGVWGITLPWAIYIMEEHIHKDWLIRHERKHEEQMQRLGVFRFLVTYLWYQVKYGYHDNPFEVEARSVEQRKENHADSGSSTIGGDRA